MGNKPTRFILSEAERSHNEVARLLSGALDAAHSVTNTAASGVWMQDIYDDHVIYTLDGPPPKTYSRTYVIAVDDDAVTLGEPTEVKVQTEYVPVREGVAAHSGALLEALDADGWRWRVQVIQAGESRNGNEYPLSVLHAAAPLYEGVPVFPCLLYTSPSPRDRTRSRMPSSA